MKGGLAFLACLAFGASVSEAQQPPAIEIALPNQLPRAQTTVVHVAIPTPQTFTAAEVMPAAGVAVTRVANAKKAELSQNVAWWDVTIQVSADAAPGPRSLVLTGPSLHSTAAPVTIPGHVPAISGLTIASTTPKAVTAQFTLADERADVGDLPYVWFTVACGGEPLVGVVRGARVGETVRATIPRPAAAPCDLSLRASDSQKIDSNTLKARVP